ncbi:MAG: formylglycine-generating enzyme family protein [Gemmatimonadota bacterium]|nr:formylglycine-generating enzyme family protein [Gemmatimonadota bacterium]MDH3423260.1 formylglycine-generating enzyme family protein [Gemmatimonadota bacterium]
MSETNATEKRMRWGVPVAEVALVAAVWFSLQLAGSDPGATTRRPGTDVPVPAELPGFRSDAWLLPDEPLLGFVEIPSGPFTMGSDSAEDPLAYDVERWLATQPQGIVDVPTFYIGRYEVTVAQYAAFVRETGHVVVDPTALQAPPDHPVTGVAWTDAVAYTRWLERALASSATTPSALSELLRTGWRVALPSEAQWEKAARGGDGRVYPWGDDARQDRAVFGVRGTAPVGSVACPECSYGLADMSGNVWEWTRSPYQPYPYDEADDRAGLDTEALWVMRGGAFNDTAQNIRAAGRGGADPGARRPFIGFRLVITR